MSADDRGWPRPDASDICTSGEQKSGSGAATGNSAEAFRRGNASGAFDGAGDAGAAAEDAAATQDIQSGAEICRDRSCVARVGDCSGEVRAGFAE